MKSSVWKEIYILDNSGERHPFDPEELQVRLDGCFSAAGMRAGAYAAEDIAAAAECALLRRAEEATDSEEAVFTASDLEETVAHTLDELGFGAAAVYYRTGGGRNSAFLQPGRTGGIRSFLADNLSCAPNFLAGITGDVTDALRKLHIRQADSALVLELARHYLRLRAPGAANAAASGTKPAQPGIRKERLLPLLPAEAAAMVERGELAVGNISDIFPRLRLELFLCKTADRAGVSSPLTEFILTPMLTRLGAGIAAARDAVVNVMMAHGVPLPFQLTICDLPRFMAEYCGAEWSRDCALEKEIVSALCAPLGGGLDRLTVKTPPRS